LKRSFTVLTLNLWNRADPWEQRLVVIRETLARLRPDLVTLQEVVHMPEHGFDQAALVAEGSGYHRAHAEVPGPMPFGNALLSRWPIDYRDVVRLPDLGSGENRCALYTRVASPWGTLPVVTTHLNWKPRHGHIRIAQVRAITARIAALHDELDLPVVLTGDFNAEPESDEIRYLRGYTGLGEACVYYNDCFAAAGVGTGHTFVRRNPNARLAREPDRRLDYIFVAGPDDQLRGVPLSCALCFDEAVDGVWASDHFGVWAEIEV
jgi:endonuclease/exonuclease/phosphatase family metal-dependent hydrolase